MQERNKNIINHSEKLNNWLWAESVVSKPELPFDSFGKAKYILFRYGTSAPYYWFTTTCRNTEESIEIMRNKFKMLQSERKYCSIYKVQNGITELIFSDKPVWMP